MPYLFTRLSSSSGLLDLRWLRRKESVEAEISS
jgi:hypothetical protein